MSINAPISEVFTYFARPEHMADQFPENMGLNITIRSQEWLWGWNNI